MPWAELNQQIRLFATSICNYLHPSQLYWHLNLYIKLTVPSHVIIILHLLLLIRVPSLVSSPDTWQGTCTLFPQPLNNWWVNNAEKNPRSLNSVLFVFVYTILKISWFLLWFEIWGLVSTWLPSGRRHERHRGGHLKVKHNQVKWSESKIQLEPMLSSLCYLCCVKMGCRNSQQSVHLVPFCHPAWLLQPSRHSREWPDLNFNSVYRCKLIV